MFWADYSPEKSKKDESQAGQYYTPEQAKELTASEQYLKEKQDYAEYLRNKQSMQYFKIKQQWKKEGPESGLEAKVYEEQEATREQDERLLNKLIKPKEKDQLVHKEFKDTLISPELIKEQDTFRKYFVQELGIPVEVVDMIQIYKLKDLMVFKAYTPEELKNMYATYAIEEEQKLEEKEYIRQTQSFRRPDWMDEESEVRFSRDANVLFYVGSEEDIEDFEKGQHEE